MLKWFCKHEWDSHSKKEYTWDEETPVKGTEWWISPKYEKITYSQIVEILICKKCGKIKKIHY